MSKNNRSFFRIDVMLPCSYHIMSATAAEQNPLPSSADTAYIEKYFLENLTQLDEQISEIIGQIGTRSQLVATALTAINSKVNFLMQTVNEKDLSHAIPQKMVNMSAGGIALDIDQKIEMTDIVDILIQPLKEESPLLVRCKVVKVFPPKPTQTGSSVALEFMEMAEDDRRKIVYFIQSKEIEMVNLERNEMQ